MDQAEEVLNLDILQIDGHIVSTPSPDIEDATWPTITAP